MTDKQQPEALRIADKLDYAAQPAGAQQPATSVVAHKACKPDMLVNGGALKLALNVLRRAGKHEVADELEATTQPLPASHGQAPAQAAPAAVAGPSDEMVLAAARVLSPGLFRHGLDPQPKDGPHTTSHMRKEAELFRRMLEAALVAAPTTQPAPADSVLEGAVLLKEARDALWQPANVAPCERIDAYLDAARCLCGAPADRNLTWPTSSGPVGMDFCRDCADAWWKTYKNTPSGQGLPIRPVAVKERVEP